MEYSNKSVLLLPVLKVCGDMMCYFGWSALYLDGVAMAGVGAFGPPGGGVAWANLGREFGLQLSDLGNRVGLVPASAFK